MTRVKISIFIMVVLIAASITSGVWVNSRCEKLLNTLDNIRYSFENGSTDKAADIAEELSLQWDKFRKTANVIVKSDKLSEIDRISARIAPLLESGSDEINAELDELEKMLTALQKGEMPLFSSVF